MRRHNLDGLSLAFGLLFSVVGLLLIGGVKLSDRLVGPWVGPVVLIALAAIIVIAVKPRSSGTDGDSDSGEAGDADESPAT
jgi:branched-subunit amino acid permease